MAYAFVHALSLCLLIAVIAAGGVVVERFAPQLSLPAYRPILRLVLGLLFWIGLLFLLAMVGLLWAAPIRIAGAAVVVGAIVVRRQRGVPVERPSAGANWAVLLPLATVVGVVGVLGIEALRPSPAWDASAYHLTIPRLYLEHGGFRPIMFNVYSHWPLNVELLFALGMALHDHLLATLIQPLFAALIAWLLVRICTIHGHPHAGPVAACLFLANDVVLFEGGVAYVDMGLAFFFLAALACVLEAERDASMTRRALTIAGICCGLMAGVKLIGLFGLASLSLLWLRRAWRRRTLGQGMQETVAYLVLPCLLLALPWYAKAAWDTGNPVYPFFHQWLRGDEWSRRLGDQFQDWQQAMGMGRSARDYLLLPLRVVRDAGPGYDRFDGRVSLAWLALVPVILAGAWRSIPVRQAGLVALLYFLFWAFSSQQARFLLPALAVLSLAAALTIDQLPSAHPRRCVRPVVAALIGLIASVHLAVAAGPTASDARRWWGRYRTEGASLIDDAVPPVFQFVNDTLPMDARLLFLNTNMGFFCRREFVADSFFEASQVNTFLLRNRQAKEIQSTLLAQGFTHVLVGHDRWAIPYPPTLDEFFADRTRLIYTSPQGDVLNEIQHPAAGPAPAAPDIAVGR